jgi:regulator of sigma E protease
MVTELLSSLLSMSLSLLGITFIIVFHEFGHFLFAKLCKVYTPTFSIGIGKVLFSKKIGDTDFCLSAGPIGGYVEIATEEGKGNSVGFNSIPYYQKLLIMFGGILFNIILTYLIFALLFFTGAPESPMLPYNRNTTTVESVPEDSPNSNVLQAGDVITSIAKINIENDSSVLLQEVRTTAEEEYGSVHATILRNNRSKKVTLQVAEYNKKFFSIKQYLNVELSKKAPLSFTGSMKQAYSTTILYIKAISGSLKGMFSGKKLDGFSGPIMAIAIGSKGAKKGLSHLLLLLAIISINLAIMNLLPLPIFDGGQIVIHTIEALLGRKLSDKVQNIIGTGSWFFVLGLITLFSIKDLYILFFKDLIAKFF